MATFSGHLQQLGPGVLVTNVETSVDPMNHRNKIFLELSVDRSQIDVFTEIVRGLQKMMQPIYSMTTPSSGYPPPEPAYVTEEPRNDNSNSNGAVTMEALREELLSRLDDVDQALRLLVDP